MTGAGRRTIMGAGAIAVIIGTGFLEAYGARRGFPGGIAETITVGRRCRRPLSLVQELDSATTVGISGSMPDSISGWALDSTPLFRGEASFR